MRASESEQDDVAADYGRRFAEGEPLRDIFDIDDDSLGLIEAKAFELYRNGQLDHARVIIKGVMSLDSTRYYPHLLTADLDARAGNLHEALAHAQRANELRANDPCTMAKLGEIHMMCGQTPEARRVLEQVVHQVEDPNDPYRRRSMALLKVIGMATESRPEAAR